MANGPHSPLPALMVALTIAACDRTPAHQPVRGFPVDAIAALAQRESVLTSTPDTARLRAYMLAMTEEPHHAGSPGKRSRNSNPTALYQRMVSSMSWVFKMTWAAPSTMYPIVGPVGT